MTIVGFYANSLGPLGSVGAALNALALEQPQNPLAAPPYQSIVATPVPPPVPPIAPFNGLLLPIAAAANALPAPPNSWFIAQLHDHQLSYFVIQNIYYNNGANDGSRLVFPTAMQALVECARLNVALQAMVRAVPGWEDWVFPYTGEGWSVEMLCHGVAIPRYAGGFWPKSFAGIVGKAIYAGILANMEQMTLGPAEQLNGVQRGFLVIPIAVQQVRREYERRSVLYDPGD